MKSFKLINTVNSSTLQTSKSKDKIKGITLEKGKVNFQALKYDLSEYFYNKKDETKANASIQFNFQNDIDQDQSNRWERMTNFILEPITHKSLIDLIDKHEHQKDERMRNIPFKFVQKKDFINKNSFDDTLKINHTRSVGKSFKM